MVPKKRDLKNRVRSKTIGFRVSPEEWAQFETAVRLSGLTKQDYLIRRILQRDIIVQGNPRTYKALRDELAKVKTALEQVEQVDDELKEILLLMTQTLHGLKEEHHA